MKTAKIKAPFIRFRFSDGTTGDVDLLAAVLQTDSQKSRLLAMEEQRRQKIIIQRADTTKADTNERYKDLDQKILACWARGEDTRVYVKAWASQNKPRVSTDTVYRRMRQLKPK